MTWNGIRGTLQWFLFLLLIATIAVGLAIAHFWTLKDEYIRSSLSQTLSEIFPDSDIAFQGVMLTPDARLEVVNLSLSSKTTGSLLVQMPRFSVQLDADALQAGRSIVVREVDLESPTFFVLQQGDVINNWEDFSVSKPNQTYSPLVNVRNGTIKYGLQRSVAEPVHEIQMSGVNVKARPTAYRRYDVKGSALAEKIGKLDLDGEVDSTTGEWNLRGAMKSLRLDTPMVDLTGQFVPQIEQKLAELKRQSPLGTNTQTESQFTLVGQVSTTTKPRDLFRADVDVTFELGQKSTASPLDYNVKSRVANGYISDLLLPIPLYDVTASLEISPDQIRIDHFEGSNNQSSLNLSGSAKRLGEAWQNNFSVKAQSLRIDERIEAVLPADMKPTFRMVRPSGTFDLDFDVSQSVDSEWTVALRTFTARDCRAKHEYFQYPIEQIHGTVTHHDQKFHYDLIGRAGSQPVTLKGFCSDRFGDGTSDLSIVVNRLPVDQTFVNSLQMENQQGIRDAIESMRLSGTVDLAARFRRNTETGGRFKMTLHGDLNDGTVNFTGFPYELEDFAGTIDFDGSQDAIWRMSNLRARHGHASFTGRCAVDASMSPPALVLEFGCVRVPIDSDLEKASLVSAPHLSPIWTDFELEGTVDVDRVTIGWRSGEETKVTLQRIQWKDGALKPIAFPYQWDNVFGTLEWDGKQLAIHSLNGWHNETYLHIDGTDSDRPAFVEVPENSPVAWHVHFGDLKLMKLKIDTDLLKALPVDLSNALAGVDLKGPTDLNFNVDMKGWNANSDVITADWEIFARLNGNDLFAGIPVTDAVGQVKIQSGTWDGQNLLMEGYFELASAKAMGVTFRKVRSPLVITQERVVIGRAVPKKGEKVPAIEEKIHSETNPFRETPLRSEVYGGQVGLDVEAIFAARPELTQYRGELLIKDAELSEWAADQFTTAERLRGKVNGQLDFQGIGPSQTATTGKGWINISPAAIYELPAFAQLFALPNFRRVGNTAFDYAYADFTLNRGRFDFPYIALNGDALGLTGRGTVGYAAGKESLVSLDFASKLNNQVPLLRNIIQPLGSNWIRVQVNGTVNDPKAFIQPSLGPLEDLVRQFGSAMNGRSPIPKR